MADKAQAGVLASLPRTRPHRRSAKRPPAELAGEPAQASAAPTVTEAKSDAAKPKQPAKTTARARTAQGRTVKAGAAKPAAKTRTAKAAAAKTRTAKTTAAKPAAKTRTAKAAAAKPAAKTRTAKPTAAKPGPGHPTQPRTQAPRRAGATPPVPDPAAGPLGTAVQAAAELAEIGMMASARALRGALSRLPRP